MAYDALRTIMLTIPEGTVNWRFHARAGFGDAADATTAFAGSVNSRGLENRTASPANWLCRYPVLMGFLSARPCREGASRVLRVKKRTIGGCGEYAGERGLY
jgi:hypothetical protein